MGQRSRVPILVVLVIVALLALWARSYYAGGPHDLQLHGRVIISEPEHIARTGDHCAGTGDLAMLSAGAGLDIVPEGKPSVAATLADGTIMADGSCELPFSATVADAMSYRFSLPGLRDLTRDQYLIDNKGDSGKLELAPILRWD